jgi:hypothetical protein
LLRSLPIWVGIYVVSRQIPRGGQCGNDCHNFNFLCCFSTLYWLLVRFYWSLVCVCMAFWLQKIGKAVGDWFYDRSAFEKIDCAYPCNPTCVSIDSESWEQAPSVYLLSLRNMPISWVEFISYTTSWVRVLLLWVVIVYVMLVRKRVIIHVITIIKWLSLMLKY